MEETKRFIMKMLYNIGDSIFSPIGTTTSQNMEAISRGDSALKSYTKRFQLPEPFFASLFSENQIDDHFSSLIHSDIRLTRMEKVAILAAAGAIQNAGIDASRNDVIFVISTTKGNVELLDNQDGYDKKRLFLWRSAQLIAQHFHNTNEPIVVSNACISGCAAQIAAARALNNTQYQYAIVIGADVLSKFVISGFQSFKALSSELCQPFDENRVGLNLGEAAAAIVYTNDEHHTRVTSNTMCLINGAICNDANHISGPSRTAEGLFAAIEKTLQDFDKQQLAFINAHGTATRYNDDMESIAINRSKLSDIPVNSLKGYFGHTLGAAGVLEVILSSQAILQKRVLATRGTQTPGTAATVHVTLQEESTDRSAFLKIISGFGGGNAALVISKKGATNE